ncbi:MAG: glycoside hydrolase family 15 protein [Actinomycetota bacterium]
MAETRYPPISDYALIGDCHSAALVSRDGSIDWCCFHRFDARPVFSRILDWDQGGYCRIAPTSGYRVVERRYLPETNILETTFKTSGGTVLVIDSFDIGDKTGGPAEWEHHPLHRLRRLIRCTDGRAEVEVDIRPRFDYGRTTPRMEMVSDREAMVYGGADGLTLQADFPLEQSEMCRAITRHDMEEGDEKFVVMTFQPPHRMRMTQTSLRDARTALETAEKFWQEWAGRCEYEGPYRDEVLRSALVIKALTNSPTGGIVAAPTTSLPEHVGGSRNWDYRYAWLRDAAMNLYALFILGYTDEAHAFMTWVKRTTAGRTEDLQPVYGVAGEHLLHEIELDYLEGYRGSRPVRIGNRAAKQCQWDIYGELMDTAWLYHRHGGEIDEVFWEFLSDLVDTVQEDWSKPDEGIWEQRGGRAQFVSSKVMCWVAVDRAINIARRLGLPADQDRWRKLRREIRKTVQRRGVDARTGAFKRSYGNRGLDAANLLIPLVGFLRPDDHRVIATFERIRKEMSADGLVYRYVAEDGLPGPEGAFVICSFWLVDNLAMAGRLEEARELFERICAHSNDVGLLSEEIDPKTGEFLGNFPQAFSHVGLIGAAMNIAKAEERAG